MEIGTLGDCLTVAYSTCTGTGVMKVIGTSIHSFSTQVILVLTAIMGIILAFFLFRLALRWIKGAVH